MGLYGIQCQINKKLVTLFRRNLRFRESKVMDLMADWFTKTFGLDVDDVSITESFMYGIPYPNDLM